MLRYRCFLAAIATALLVISTPSTGAAQTYGVSVTPDGTSISGVTIHTTGNTTTFRVSNTGTCNPLEFTCINFVISCVGASNVACTNWPADVQVAPGSFQDITITFSTGNEGTGQLTVTASGIGASDQGYVVVPVVVPSGAPKLSVLPYLDSKQDYGRCAASCFAVTYAQSSVPYFSLDAPRNVTLVYHGDRVAPKPFVLIDIRPDSSHGTWPTEYQLQVKINGSLVTFLNGETLLRFANPGNVTYRIGGQFSPPADSNGTVRPMEILVSAKHGVTLVTNRWVTQYLHVDEAKSRIARGWTIAGVQRAFTTAGVGILVTEGDGGATYFKWNVVTGVYETPAGDFSRLVPSGSNWVRVYPDSTKVTFNSAGRMVRIADRWGVRDSIVYDGNGRVTQIRDHLNNAITLGYGTYGLSTITDPASRVTSVLVASDTTMSWIQDPDGLKTTLGYDGSRRLLSITRRNNKTTTFAYDAQSGKISSVTAPSIPLFGGSGSPVTSFAPWHKLGVPYIATSTTPFSPVLPDTAYARVTEPGGIYTRFSVNRWGSPVRAIQLPADTTIVAYTTTGLPARIVRPGYGATDYDTLAYNGSGLLTYSKPAQTSFTRMTYGSYSQLATRVTQFRDSTTYFRGSLGRLDSVRVGSTTLARHTSYDTYGRPTEIRRANFDTTKYAYYSSGSHRNLSTVAVSGGRVTTYRYDSYGRPTFVDTPAPADDSISYNTMNQVTTRRQRTAGGALITTGFQYDSTFNVVQVTDPKGQVYKYRYNALGWLIRQEDPAGKRDTLQYSLAGDVLRVTDRRNLSVDFTYDSLHRIRTRKGTDTVEYIYSMQGRRIVGVSGVARDTINFNVRGQPETAITRMAGQRYERVYRYTSAGLQDTVRISGGVSLTTRAYGWDVSRGLLISIKLGAANTTIGYDGGLLPSSIALPGSGGSITRTFGSLMAPVKITSSAQSGTTERWIGFGPTGQIVSHLQPGGQSGRFFVYDSLGRFQQAADSVAVSGTPPPGCPDGVEYSIACHTAMTWNYISGTAVRDTFDVVGNRLSKGGAYTVGTNRISAFNGCTYVTNAAGGDSVRTCGATVTTFTWNREGQLSGFTVTGQPAVALRYDAFGRLVKKVSGGTDSYFLWDGNHLAAELGGAGTTVTAEYSYYPGTDRLHAMIIGGTRYYAHADGLGNVIALTNESGNLNRTLKYDDWGQLTASTDPGSVFGNKDRARWKGALWLGPETELYYMRHRWYEPRTGRFISEDPSGLAGGINPYVFAENDPIGGRDPRGLCGEGFEEWAVFTVTYYSDGSRRITIHSTFCVPIDGGGGGGRARPTEIRSIPRIHACAADEPFPSSANAPELRFDRVPSLVGSAAFTLAGIIHMDLKKFSNMSDLARAGLLSHEMHHIRSERDQGVDPHAASWLWEWGKEFVKGGFGAYGRIPEEKTARIIQVLFQKTVDGAGVCRRTDG